MIEHGDRRGERDHFLAVVSVVGAANALLNGFRDWIDEELTDLVERVRFAQLLASGDDRQRLDRVARRLTDVETTELPDCVNELRERIADISNGAYDSVTDARRWVEVPCNRFENIVLELLSYRPLLVHGEANGEGE